LFIPTFWVSIKLDARLVLQSQKDRTNKTLRISPAMKMHWGVLVLLPLCSPFSPFVVPVRNQSSYLYRFAATKRKRGDAEQTSKNPKPAEVSELIQAAAWSIIALSNHVLATAPEGGQTSPGSIGAKDAVVDDLLSDVDTPELRSSLSKKSSVAAVARPDAAATVSSNDPAVPNDTKATSTSKPKMGKPKIQWIKRHQEDDAPTQAPRVVVPADTLSGAKPPPSMPPTLQDKPTTTSAAPQPLGKTWSELLVKDDSLSTFELSDSKQAPRLESLPRKEEIRLKLLQEDTERADSSMEEALYGDDDEDDSFESENQSTLNTPHDNDTLSTSSPPPIPESISTSFGKPLPVTTAGLSPLRQWPEPEANQENTVVF
jgi:hypothetical protein